MYDARIVKIEKLPNWRVERHGPRGGGNRHGVRDVVRGADLAAKRDLDAKRQRCEDAESVTELILENSSDEYESIVGWTHQPNNETENFSIVGTMQGFSLRGRELERGVDLSFCNCENTPLSRISNAHNSSQRTATSSLGEVSVMTHDNNSTQLQGKKTNSSETDHVSKPLGIFASKSVSCRTSKSDLHKKAAFTLAEVLITLGIIGVVAALTLPTVIANYQKQVTVTKLQKAYTILNQAFRQSEVDNGSSESWQETNEIGVDEYFDRYWKKYFNEPVYCQTAQECGYSGPSPYKKFNGSTSGVIWIGKPRVFFKTSDGVFYLFVDSTTNANGEIHAVNFVFIDINGAKAPNTYGIDVFRFNRVAGKGIIPYGSNTSLATNVARCNPQSDGEYCAARIMQEGWKINYSFK